MKEICIINDLSNAATYGTSTDIKVYDQYFLNIGLKVTRIELGTDISKREIYIKENDNEKNIYISHINLHVIAAKYLL